MNKEKLLKLIAARQAKLDELKTRSDASEDVKELRSISVEMETINAEIEQFRSLIEEADKAEEARSKQKQVLGAYGAKKEETDAQRDSAPSDVEKRAAEFVSTRKSEIGLDDVKRAITIGSGDLAQPTNVQGSINEKFNEVSSVVDLVSVESAAGMGEHQVPYVKAYGEGGVTAEGNDYNEDDPDFGYASMKPTKITVYTEVSRESTKLTPVNYLNKVRQAALIALRKKVGKLIVVGDPTATPAQLTGIINAEAIEADALEFTAIDDKTLRKIAMSYGGDENVVGNAVLMLNKADLIAFGDIRGSQDKKPVYEITPDGSNPNTGIIRDGGLSVRYVINSVFPALSATATDAATVCMAYGVPSAYQLALFSPYVIEVSEEAAFKKGMLAVRGEVMVGGNVVSHDGFVLVAKKAS